VILDFTVFLLVIEQGRTGEPPVPRELFEYPT